MLKYFFRKNQKGFTPHLSQKGGGFTPHLSQGGRVKPVGFLRKKGAGFTLIELERSKSVRRNEGFTLIELLVVIAIIGLLASIALVSLGGARAKARDAKRMSDIRQYGLAMEMYYNFNSPNTYPDLPDTAIAIPSNSTLLQPYLNPPLPLDPTNSGNYIYYWTDKGAPLTVFCVWARLESPSAATWIISNQRGTRETTVQPTVTNCDTL